MQQKREPRELYWIGGIALLTGLLFFSRGLAWLIPTLIMPLTLIFLGFVLWKAFSQKKEKPVEPEVADLQQLVKNCDTSLAELRRKASSISSNIEELEQKLKQSPNLAAKLHAETIELINSFEAQAKVIDAKLSFYEDMKLRISDLMSNHTWKLRLKQKQEELKNLKEDHYDDVEKMESVKQDVAYSTGFFTAIRQLSEDIETSSSALDINQLKKELERLMPK